MFKEKSVGAIILRKEKSEIYYLLLEHKGKLGHDWDFPKGLVKNREKEEETATREIFEETGIKDLEFIPGFRQAIKYFFRRQGKLISKTAVFYLAQTKTKNIKISWEHTWYKWLPYQEALQQLTFQNAKEILKKADDFLKQKRRLRRLLFEPKIS